MKHRTATESLITGSANFPKKSDMIPLRKLPLIYHVFGRTPKSGRWCTPQHLSLWVLPTFAAFA
jgi:hypothetical protein